MQIERNDEARADVTAGHPRGTLAIIAIYALLFLVGWLALYYLTYAPRGPVLP